MNCLKKYNVGVIITLLLILTSCLEQIELEVPRGEEEALVIQGRLIYGSPNSVVDINISKLFNFTPQSFQPVNVRFVKLQDESGSSVELNSPSTGFYTRTFSENDPEMNIVVGKSYKIVVSTFDGRSYESSFEKINTVPAIKGIEPFIISKEVVSGSELTENKDFIQFFIDTDFLTAPTYLKWDISHAFKITDSPVDFEIRQKTCYVTENIDVTNVKVFSSEDFTAPGLQKYQLYEAPVDYHFAEGYYISIVQQSLSKGAYDYWNQIRQVVEREGNMFEAPAGKLTTNIFSTNDDQDQIYGYFYATATDTSRLYISLDFAGRPDTLCPPPTLLNQVGDCNFPICCDCLSVDGSSIFKPFYWKE